MDDLARYIANYYSHLMTEEERVAHRTLMGEFKVRNAEDLRLKAVLGNWLISKNPAVLKLLSDGPDAFWDRVRDRVTEIPSERERLIEWVDLVANETTEKGKSQK